MFHSQSDSHSHTPPSSQSGSSSPYLQSEPVTKPTRLSGPITGTGYVPHRQYQFRNSLVLPSRPSPPHLSASEPTIKVGLNGANSPNLNPDPKASVKQRFHSGSLPQSSVFTSEAGTLAACQTYPSRDGASSVPLPNRDPRGGSRHSLESQQAYDNPTSPPTQAVCPSTSQGTSFSNSSVGVVGNTSAIYIAPQAQISESGPRAGGRRASQDSPVPPPIPWATKPRRYTGSLSDGISKSSPPPPVPSKTPATRPGPLPTGGHPHSVDATAPAAMNVHAPLIPEHTNSYGSLEARIFELSLSPDPRLHTAPAENRPSPPDSENVVRPSHLNTVGGAAQTHPFIGTPPPAMDPSTLPPRDDHSSPSIGGVSLALANPKSHLPSLSGSDTCNHGLTGTPLNSSHSSLSLPLPLPPPPPPPPSRLPFTYPPSNLPTPPNSRSFSSSTSSAPTSWKIRPYGPANEFISSCPSYTPLHFKSYTYRLKGNGEFPICSACFLQHIYYSPFASEFIRDSESTEGAICRFNVPRIINLLWPHAISTRSLHHLAEYMFCRVRINDCRREQFVLGQDGFKWYSPVSENPPGFIVCEACYEDKLVGTGLERNLRVHPEVQPLYQTWSCDFYLDYFSRVIPIYARTNAWSHFASVILHRLSRKQCSPELVPMTSRVWYRPKRPMSPFLICEACYLDHIDITEYSKEFDVVPSDFFFGTALHMSRCQFSKVPVQLAWKQVKESKSMDLWWTTANAISNSPDCVPGGFQSGIWYTLDDTTSNFDICPACYAGILTSYGLGYYFQKANRNPGHPRACDFNPHSPRFHKLIQIFHEVVQLGVFAPLSDYIARFTHLPICPQATPVRDQRWYGFEDGCLMCPECFEDVGRGSSIRSQFTATGQIRADPQACELYSPPMRALWSRLCNDHSFLPQFLSSAKQWRQAAEQSERLGLEGVQLQEQSEASERAQMVLDKISSIVPEF